MRQWEIRRRKFDEEEASVFVFKGFVFPKYEGRLTKDEIRSKKTFYAFWGGIYLPQAAIRLRVCDLLNNGKLAEAA
jgi:hypothetical protein